MNGRGPLASISNRPDRSAISNERSKSSISHASGDDVVTNDQRLGSLTGGYQRRLVEYFVVVSSVLRPREDSNSTAGPEVRRPCNSNDSEDSVPDFIFQPLITARYPLEDHEDNPLHESITCFCHPSGDIKPQENNSMPKVHFFVATGATGQRIYGTCLTLYEPYKLPATEISETFYDDMGEPVLVTNQRRKEVYLPKVLCVLSAWPYLAAFREFLTQLYRLTRSGTMPLPIERYITNFCAEIPAPPPGSFEVQTTISDSVIKLWSPPHNQPIPWVSVPFSHLFQCLDLSNIMLVWHALSLERQVLITSTQLSLLTTCSEILLSFLFPMRWSHAYIPVLPKFMMPILSAPMPYFCGIDKSNLPEALLDLSRECIVVDLDKNYVTLGPMTPPLPALPLAHNQAVRNKLEECAGMVYKEVRCLSRTHDTSDMGQNLPSHIKTMADAAWEGRLCLFDDAFHLYFTPEESRKNMLNGDSPDYSMDWNQDRNIPLHIRVMSRAERQKLKRQSNWDAVQECFLSIYIYMLRNYRKFLVFPGNKEHDGEDSSNEDAASYSYGGFRTKPFIQSQRRDMQPYLRELCSTQQFDNFLTKRLYGSGEADVLFFDSAINKVYGDIGPRQNRRKSGIGAGAMFRSDRDPLLQSAGVRRKLKTIVPPEPNSTDLPPQSAEMKEHAQAFLESNEAVVPQDDDDVSVITAHSVGSYSGRSAHSGSAMSPKKNNRKTNDEIYVYPTFPQEFDTDIFGTPRPLPSAVLTEFERQREDAARFRRRVAQPTDDKSSSSAPPITQAHVMDNQLSASSEVATFTLFFMSFTALVGKELIQISRDPDFGKDRLILSSCMSHAKQNEDEDKQDNGHDDAATTEVTEESSYDGHGNRLDESYDENFSGHEIDGNRRPTGGLGEGDEEDVRASEDEDASQRELVSDACGHELQPASCADNSHGDNEYCFEDDYLSDKEELVECEYVASGSTELVEEPFGDEYTGGADTMHHGMRERDISKDRADTPSNEVHHGMRERDISKDRADTPSNEVASRTSDSEGEMQSPHRRGHSDTLLAGSSSSDGDKTHSRAKSIPPVLRNRFQNKLSDLEIEEAKATAKAQLGLAFDILQMMRERSLKADPAAYQCLIEACGRCGDTERATQLLSRMHQDGIVADGVVYSCLVSAFNAENSWKQRSGKSEDDLPEWANKAASRFDWNTLRRETYMDMAKRRLNSISQNLNSVPATNDVLTKEDRVPAWRRRSERLLHGLRGRRNNQRKDSRNGAARSARAQSTDNTRKKGNDIIVTEPVLMQILLGENLLELLYPDVSIELEEYCPRCHKYLTDGEVVAGWVSSDSQNYTTTCPTCSQKFVPHFSIQSTSPSFVGSKGPSSPLFCERLSPWVLQKELRTILGDNEGIEGFLKPEWREKEARRATLWWNLVVSFMRYRLPVSFLLQGSFETSLIAPTPTES